VEWTGKWPIEAQFFHTQLATWPDGIFMSRPTRRPEDWFPAFIDAWGNFQRVHDGDAFCRIKMVATAGPRSGETFYWHFRLSAEIFHALFTRPDPIMQHAASDWMMK
jgi:hypothetical protein